MKREPIVKSVSYWQQGCNDARAGAYMDPDLFTDEGYVNGFLYGQGIPRKWWWKEDGEFQAPAASPYMDLIGKVEEALEAVNDPTNGIDRTRRDAYSLNLLEVRDALHRFRQEEVGGG